MKLVIQVGSIEEVYQYGTSAISQLLHGLQERDLHPKTAVEMLECIAIICEEEEER